MNFKTCLFLALIIATIFTSGTEARRKTNHNSSNKHASTSHHNEGGHNTIQNDHHTSSKQHNQDAQHEHIAPARGDISQNNQMTNPHSNTQHKTAKSSESDFAAGFAAGSAAARRNRRRRTTTVAPSTTTTNPCSNHSQITANSQPKSQVNPQFNCESLSTTENTSPDNLINNTNQPQLL